LLAAVREEEPSILAKVVISVKAKLRRR